MDFKEAMNERDSLRRFLFAGRGVRGEWVRLDRSWREAHRHCDYPPSVQQQLGQALAAAVLLAATVKFKGALILQAQGDGPLRTLVAQATHDHCIRGLARHQADVPGGGLQTVYGQGHLLLTIQSENAEPYQGIVELTGNNLAEALQTYFTRSEQLQTRLWLYADATRATGLLLQELPAQQSPKNDWEHLQILAGTLTEYELRNLSCEDLLNRLFYEENIRLFDAGTVAFQCTCSSGKIENTLLSLGRKAVEEILHAQGEISVACEFCNRNSRFDKSDVQRIFNAYENC
jgi:molecular chaperone Hsp33